MDSKQELRLNYTEDFRVACTINGMKCDEVLQYFINKVSFYAFNGGEMDASAMVATNIILECKEDLGSNLVPVKERKIQRIFIKHISILSKLALNPHLTTLEKIQESFYLMEEWALEMLPLVDYDATVLTEDGVSLVVSFDFNLLCKVNGLEVIDVVQYFMDRISLPTDRALNLHCHVKTETSLALLEMLLTSRSHSDQKIIRTETYERFREKLNDLDGWLADEKRLEARIQAYRTFYMGWYNTLAQGLEGG